MYMSQLFSHTLRDAPAEADIASHQLLLRGGYIRPLAAGIFSYLPLARRAFNKIEAIIREEMNAIGGQEMTMPVVHPAELWQKTGRWYKIGSEMGRFQDKHGREMVLAMTHEEVVADLARSEIRSYRDLPRLIYHIQTKWRDDPRPRAGLIRVREFTMKDSYSLDADWDGLDKQYRAHYQAYFNIFHRCGLPVIAVKSDTGMMGGQLAHEYMFLTPIGEDTLLICAQEACRYAANRQVARFRKPAPAQENSLELEKVATPGARSIEALADFLTIPTARTAKAVFMTATRLIDPDDAPERQHHGKGRAAERYHAETLLVFAIVRGDMEVNETKLANVLNARELRPATEEEICAIGATPGYASPVGLSSPTHLTRGMKDNGITATGPHSKVVIVVDDLIPLSPNLVAGANEAGFHLRNVNYGRDYQADIVADIAAAQEGDACPNCGHPMQAVRGVEVGNIFKLGSHFSEALEAHFLDQDRLKRPVVMGSYGIGVGRLLACAAEARHDDYGLIWPATIAPYDVHIVLLKGKNAGQPGEAEAAAERLYQALWAAGVETLMDDRDESPGIKFNDADLIGLPIRLTVAERGLKAGGVEIKRRDRAEKQLVALDKAVDEVKAWVAEMRAEIMQTVRPIPYPEE